MADPDAPLAPVEFACLGIVAKNEGDSQLASKYRDKLIALGLIEQKLGGLVVTPLGHMRLAKGR